MRKLMCATLRKAGYTILEAPNGAQALSLCASYRDPIHLVISDVIMPGISGTGARQAGRERTCGNEGTFHLGIHQHSHAEFRSTARTSTREAVFP